MRTPLFRKVIYILWQYLNIT